MAADEREKERRVFQIVLAMVILTLCAAFLLVPSTTMESLQRHQNNLIAEELGNPAQNAIAGHVTGEFKRWFVESGAVEASYAGLGDMADKAKSFWIGIWLVLERFWMIVMWLPLVGPLAGAMLIDGWVRRRIGQWRFEFISRARHHYARKSAHYLVALAIAGPFFPIPMPPLLIPILWAMALVSIRTWVASLQKRY